MKKRVVSFLFLMSISWSVFTHEFKLSLIASEDLRQERQLFMDFWQVICFNDVRENEKFEDVPGMITQVFDREEADYLEQSGKSFFVHALFMDQVIGYISFDVFVDNQACVRQFALDKDMFDESLIKALVLSIFDYMPQCRKLSMDVCSEFVDLIEVLQGLGFVLNPEPLGVYELYVGDRCQICVAMHGPDFWERQEESDDDLDEESADPKNGFWGSYDVGVEHMIKAELKSGESCESGS